MIGGFEALTGELGVFPNCTRNLGPPLGGGLLDQSITQASFSSVAGSPSKGINDTAGLFGSGRTLTKPALAVSPIQLSLHTPHPSQGFSSYSNGVIIASESRMSAQLT